MIVLSLLLSLGLHAPSPRALPADSIDAYYGERNVAALDALLRRAPDRETALLCRYRLYPLTLDGRYVQDLPSDLQDATAREMALLAGLWGYRIREASPLRIPVYGRRSARLLEEARALDPEEPFVLLVDGQSLLYRPALFGGDAGAALVRFRQLYGRLRRAPTAGLSLLEAQLWIWYALRELGSAEAPALRARLLAQNPPPLFRVFLEAPPELD